MEHIKVMITKLEQHLIRKLCIKYGFMEIDPYIYANCIYLNDCQRFFIKENVFVFTPDSKMRIATLNLTGKNVKLEKYFIVPLDIHEVYENILIFTRNE